MSFAEPTIAGRCDSTEVFASSLCSELRELIEMLGLIGLYKIYLTMDESSIFYIKSVLSINEAKWDDIILYFTLASLVIIENVHIKLGARSYN